MKRLLDLALATIAGIVLLVPLVLIALIVKLTSRGPVLYWSDRVGRGNALFSMPKFRTMRIDTPVLPTHLLVDGKSYLTPVGGFLRSTSLDELPQLWSIFVGDMSIVGPRPALFNQDNLIALRTAADVHLLRPGLTGLAQVEGRDDLSIEDKAALDAEYLKRRSLMLDFELIARTVVKVLTRSGVSH